jgi:hypothetical protein
LDSSYQLLKGGYMKRKIKVSIDSIPTKEDLQLLLDDVQTCIEFYNGGRNSLTFDHLENSIARILNVELPNKEIE